MLVRIDTKNWRGNYNSRVVRFNSQQHLDNYMTKALANQVGNNVINMVVHVRSTVALLDTAVLVRDIMLMAIVLLKWKKRFEIQFMPIVKITFVSLENQKKRVRNGIYKKKQIVLSMILILTH